jgi:hypothetical protein
MTLVYTSQEDNWFSIYSFYGKGSKEFVTSQKKLSNPTLEEATRESEAFLKHPIVLLYPYFPEEKKLAKTIAAYRRKC